MKGTMKAIGLIALLFLLAACGEQTFSNSQQTGSYAGILMVGGEEYLWEGELVGSEFSSAGKLGEVLQETKPEVVPNSNFSSNFLSRGAEIHSTNEDPDVLLAKRQDGSWDVFRKTVEE